MTNVVGKTNKDAMFLLVFGGKAGFISLEVIRFIPNEAQECADVNGGAD
jgi:hypothetical protein